MICRFCGIETGTKRNHLFNYQCIRALRVDRDAQEALVAEMRLALSTLHTAADLLRGALAYEGSEMFRYISRTVQSASGRRFLEKYEEERDGRERSVQALRDVAHTLERYCDHSLPYEKMVVEAAGKIARHVSLLGGDRKTLAGSLEDREQAERMYHVLPLLKAALEKNPSLAKDPLMAKVFEEAGLP